MKPNYRNCI